MATTKTDTKKSSANQYAGMSIKDLQKAHTKLETEYQESRSKGKLTSLETSKIRKQRAQLLTAINQTNN